MTSLFNDTIGDELRAWIEARLGGDLVRVERLTHSGRSRSVWGLEVAAGGETIPLILKREVGGGPFSDTAITLGREAAVIDALGGTSVPVPKIHAVSESGDDVVMARMPGSAEFTFDDPQTEQRTVESYVGALVRLHAYDPAQLNLPFAIPIRPEAAVRANIAEFDDAYRRLCDAHRVIDQAHDWLDARAASAIERVVLTHGDAGPGNFLHADGAVTGLIDWEMTHLGDVHDDLAWLWFRTAVLKQGSDYHLFHRLYREMSGAAIDPARLAYHALLIVYRCTIVCHVRQAHDPTHDDARPRQLRDMLAAALADACGQGAHRLIPDFRAT